MKLRKDILAISEEALESLTNRGTLRRAQREVTGNKVTVEWEQSDDLTITARWSDEVTCTIPPEATLEEASCSCPAASVCRHLVRTVLAHNQLADTPPEEVSEPWDPGTISDEQLEAHFSKRVLTSAQREFEEGLLVEVVRSEKPFATIHGLGVTIRFPVRNDVRYAQADSSGQAAEKATINAVRAFRLLPKEDKAGYIVTGSSPPATPTDIVKDGEELISEIVEYGFGGASTHLPKLLHSLEERCRSANLVWPAEIVADLIEEVQRYNSHDSLFSRERGSELIAEWLARMDALESATGSIPSLLLSGTRHDVLQSLSRRRLVGLGCAPTIRKKGVELRAFLQDQESGALTYLERRFPDPEESEPRSFAHLANTPVVKGASLKDLATYHILIGSGKRSPSGKLIPGRKIAVSPQTYEWETLREPIRVESLSELAQRLSCLPPMPLRPRSERTNFHVIPVSAVVEAHFDSVTQTIKARLSDSSGAEFMVEHPYVSRGAEGFEATMNVLNNKDCQIKFVAGTVNLLPIGIVLQPTAIVFEEDGMRSVVQPWLQSEENTSDSSCNSKHIEEHFVHPLRQWIIEADSALSEMLVIGAARADQSALNRWTNLARQADELSLSHFAELTGKITNELEAFQHQRKKELSTIVEAFKELSVATLIASEIL